MPYRQITIDFPVTFQDLQMGFLQGDEEAAEIPQSRKKTSHARVRRTTQRQKRPQSTPNSPNKGKKQRGCARASNSTDISSLLSPTDRPLDANISSRTRKRGGGRTTRNDTEAVAPITRQDTLMYESEPVDSDDEEDGKVYVPLVATTRGAPSRQLKL